MSRAVLLGLSLIASLGLLEVGLRCFFTPPARLAARYPLGPGTAGSELAFRQREYQIRLRYNRDGFRDRERPGAKPEGEFRLLCLGDSFVEGVGVEVGERFCDLLEVELARRRGGPVVAVNAGQMATGPLDYFRNLVDFGVALDPDLVIVAIFVGNDFFGGRGLTRLRRRVRTRLPEPALPRAGPLRTTWVARGIAQLLGDQTFLVRNLRGRGVWEAAFGAPVDRAFYRERLAALGIEPDEFDAVAAEMDPELLRDFFEGRLNPSYLIEALTRNVVALRGEEPPASARDERDVAGVVRLLRRARAVLASHGVELLVVVIPHVHETHEAAHRVFLEALSLEPPPRLLTLPELRRQLGRDLAAADIAAVDLTEELRAAEGLPYHVMDGHWNELGHRVAARAVLREIANSAP